MDNLSKKKEIPLKENQKFKHSKIQHITLLMDLAYNCLSLHIKVFTKIHTNIPIILKEFKFSLALGGFASRTPLYSE